MTQAIRKADSAATRGFVPRLRIASSNATATT
jgi:hypothetical protein